LGEAGLLVGAPGDDADGPSSGSAHLYQRIDRSWLRRAVLAPSSPEPAALFGSSVALDRDMAAVGKQIEGDGPEVPGRAWVFRLGGTSRKESPSTATEGGRRSEPNAEDADARPPTTTRERSAADEAQRRTPWAADALEAREAADAPDALEAGDATDAPSRGVGDPPPERAVDDRDRDGRGAGGTIDALLPWFGELVLDPLRAAETAEQLARSGQRTGAAAP
jgi:hypothetical protein